MRKNAISNKTILLSEQSYMHKLKKTKHARAVFRNMQS